MPNYTYKALSLSGAMRQGEEAAASISHLRDSLATRDLILKSARSGHARQRLPRRRVALHQLAGFNRQFAVLLKAGIPIPEALSLLAKRPGQPQLEAAIELVLDDVRQGASLSAAAAKQPHVFEVAYCATLAVGEQAGSLAQSLEHYQASMELRLRLRKQMAKALVYPIVLMIALAAVLTFLFIAVIPNFIAMYRDLGSALPEATRALIFIAENFPLIGGGIAAALILLVLLDRLWTATPAGLRQKHAIALELPILGSFRRAAAAAETARILATLVLSGTPVARAFAIASQSLSDKHFAATLAEVNQAILAGQPASEALGRHELFPPTSLKMLAAGEASGSLDQMLGEIAAFHEGEVEQSLARVAMLIEPMLTLVAGVVVGGVIVAMYLPMFSLMEALR